MWVCCRARMPLLAVVVALLVSWPAGTAVGQDVALAGRGPRFLRPASSGAAPIEVDAGSSAPLRRLVSLNFARSTVGTLLESIERQTGIRFAYDVARLRTDRPVELQAQKITVAAALTAILLDTGLDVLLRSGSHVVLVARTSGAVPRAGTLAGRVTDAKTGSGVAGAEVFLEGTRWRAAADTAGRYRLAEVEAGSYELAVRRPGYAQQRRAVVVRDGQTDTVDVAMEPQAARLDELVTTATGRQRRMELGNDITTLNVDSIMQTQPITSVTDVLDGRVPGLTVQRTSGAPGDPARLRLRGASSPLQNNDPIVVVDGIRVYAQQSAGRNVNLASPIATGPNGQRDTSANAYATPSPLDFIDPNSIETIEVVKGPSAATLYGQDAANGVIVITTKKGKAGPPSWIVTAERGRSQMSGNYPDLHVRWGHSLSDGQPELCPADGITPREKLACQGDSLVTFQLLNDPALTVLDKGNHTAVSLGVTGGSSALTYSVTGSFRDEQGLIKLSGNEMTQYQDRLGTAVPDWMRRPQGLTQWATTASLRARLGANADLALSTSLARSEQRRSSLEQQLGALMRTYADRASSSYYRSEATGFDAAKLTEENFLLGYYERVTAAATTLTNGVNLSWRPRSWLTFTADAGLNVIQRADQIYLPRSVTPGSDSVGRVSHGYGNSRQGTVNLRGNAIAPIGGGFQFRFATGVQYAGTSLSDLSVATRSLPFGTSLRGDSLVSTLPREEDEATFGWYVAPSINNSRFFLDLGLRLDGGSTYGSNGKLPKFPKLGFSYLLSDESFYPFRTLIPTLRLRLAYGRASRQPGPTDRLRLYKAPQSVWGDTAAVPGAILQTIGNTELRPERTTEFEGGFDADLFDDRLRLTFTGYRKTTDDALLNFPLPPSLYGNGITVLRNIGVVRNTGLELTVGTQWIRSGAVSWGTDISVTQSRQLVVELGPGVDPFFLDDLRVAPGYPLFGRWAKPIRGYADANGSGRIEADEIVLGDTLVYVGATEPNYQANFHTTVALWQGAVAVSAGFQYQDGLSQFNGVASQLRFFSRGFNDPTASFAEQVGVSQLTDYNWIQTVNTFRFNSLSVQYRLPEALARWVGAQNMSVAVQGTNLGLWTNYRGLDPNVNAFGTGNNVTDTGVLPQPRTWQVRVNATY